VEILSSTCSALTCYPQPGKLKSLRLLEAFADGARGNIALDERLRPGAAAFYGTVGIEALWRAARARAACTPGADWYYLDNAFFDRARGRHFRVGKNALQGPLGKPSWTRYSDLHLAGIRPWCRRGRHVLVVEQSEYFMREVAGWPGGLAGWREHVLGRLRHATERPVVVRHWVRDKAERARTLAGDLDDCWALVTHASAAANEALIAGVPVFCTGPCVALEMGSGELERIESPRRPDGRQDWAARLAASQWTIEEFADGTAWKALNAA
jgi:hypothetical protein